MASSNNILTQLVCLQMHRSESCSGYTPHLTPIYFGSWQQTPRAVLCMPLLLVTMHAGCRASPPLDSTNWPLQCLQPHKAHTCTYNINIKIESGSNEFNSLFVTSVCVMINTAQCVIFNY